MEPRGVLEPSSTAPRTSRRRQVLLGQSLSSFSPLALRNSRGSRTAVSPQLRFRPSAMVARQSMVVTDTMGAMMKKLDEFRQRGLANAGGKPEAK